MSMKQSLITNQKGAVLFFTVLILATASFAALLALSRGSIDSFVDSYTHERSIVTKQNLMGCMDELLINFTLEEDYLTNSIDILEAQCNVTITTPGAGQRVAVITLTEENLTRGIRVEFTVEPVVVTRVIESYN